MSQRDEGMLFVFTEHDEPVRMWMKNTFIPLDMLFMDAKGRVDYIKVNATPLSESIISAPRPETGDSFSARFSGGFCTSNFA